ncbi:hypothetical protein B0T18DRAFT_414325 [Schizothecium vesticola]|uniref:Uncharacterized protein n=1 Tax=Schizothecium vesticola TaxID=314040 RepID=A0AA40EPE4_9PEZI|nr:hypothetical protein B0T18DRAFT_414325 [Schizothecium vesticola]
MDGRDLFFIRGQGDGNSTRGYPAGSFGVPGNKKTGQHLDTHHPARQRRRTHFPHVDINTHTQRARPQGLP